MSKDFDFVAAVTGEPSADETSLSGDNATLLSAMHAFQRGYASMGIGGRRVGRTADGLKAVLTEFRVLPSQMQAEGSTQRAVTKDMVRDALHMCPTDLSSPKRWQWIADRLNKGLNTRWPYGAPDRQETRRSHAGRRDSQRISPGDTWMI